jgi:hypothetical protein
MGAFRKYKDGEGAVFATLTAEKTSDTLAQIDTIDFLSQALTKEDCLAKYASSAESKILYNSFADYGLFPTSSAYCFAEAVKNIQEGVAEVIIYNEYFGAKPVVLKIKCVC